MSDEPIKLRPKRDDLVSVLRFNGDHATFMPHLHHTAADRIEAQNAEIARLRAELAEAEARSYDLAVVIMGGEDVPGLADGTSTEALLQLAKDERNRNRYTEDRLAEAEARGYRRGIEAAAGTAVRYGVPFCAESIRALGDKL